FSEPLVFFAKPLVLIVNNEPMNRAANVENVDFIERIDALEPVAVESENIFIKRTVESIRHADFKRLKVAAHLRADVAPLIHLDEMRAHRLNIERALVGIVRALKEGQVMPNLFDDKLALDERIALFGLDDITDIIAKRFAQSSGFSVENADIHYFIPFFRRV
ncbi:MAG: hypothetical protein IIW86_00070, partial [Clostridia bacterium]|nr:hypothetical protein [Clostridia bacterium]